MATHIGRFGMVATLAAVWACAPGGARDQPADSARVAPASDGIEGAWRVAEFRPEGGAPIANPAGVYLFTSGHYSVMYVNTAEGRKTFTKPDTATAAEKLRAYDTFVANTGTYVFAGDTLVIRPVVSRNPNYMGGGEDKLATRRAGDTLWLTSVPGAFKWATGQARAPGGGSDVFVLVRAR
jgi:hypothetical protein